MSGRRELRSELVRSWTVCEPRVRGVPITRKDLEDAEELERISVRPQAEPPRPDVSLQFDDAKPRSTADGGTRRLPSDVLVWGLIGRAAK